ncbi:MULTISPECIES: hypothetical protein [Variovorax]|uniref:hypothetical protein n=1 Tax=Variovorax sp. TaxID=1871043 RepID=UPI003BAA7758
MQRVFFHAGLVEAGRRRRRVPRLIALAFAACGCASSSMALANNVGENAAWQFQTSADKVNQAAVQDMIRKQKSGYYAAPVYNTTIGRQYNCNVSATSTGNDGNNSTVANSPSNAGANSNASGNDSRSAVGSQGGATVGTSQANSGAVGSAVVGGTSTQVQGAANQALNSTQGNTGAQTASVGGSSACAFGVLN